jgi:hypothetical protein
LKILCHMCFCAGLDVGWGNRLQMELVGPDRWQLKRQLMPGRYPYKFVMDGTWSYDIDLPLMHDGENTNNVVSVVPSGLSQAEIAARERVLTPDGRLLDDELARIQAFLGVLP